MDKTVDLSGILTALDGVLATYPISDLDFDGCEVIEWDKQMKLKLDNWAISSIMSPQRATRVIVMRSTLLRTRGSGAAVRLRKGVIGGGACIFRAGRYNLIH